jgi:methyl-accepting chemotaxis protein
MSQRVSQQFDAFGRVLGSLKNISAGTSEFTASIEDSNQTARSLGETVAMLEDITRGKVGA